MQDVITKKDNSLTTNEERNRKAFLIHNQIKANGIIAAQALVSMCRDLKTMRDEKLYTELGYADFGTYCEEAVGIGERWAYNHIQTYEKLGAEVIEENANLGITKLSILVQMNPVDMFEALESGELENMSTREVKELVEKSNAQSEQLSLLTDERNNLTEKNESLEEIVQRQKKEIEELKSRPIEVSSEPSEEKVAEIRAEVQAEFEEKYDANMKAAVKAAKAEEKAKIEKQISKAKEDAKKEADATKAKEIAEAVKKAKTEAEAETQELKSTIENYKNETAKLEKELKAADTDTQKVLIYMQAFQDNLNKTLAAIGNLAPEQQEKMTGAVKTALNQILEQIGG